MELSGTWRAQVADDDVRRDGVGLDFDDGQWPVIAVPGHWRHQAEFRGSDGPLVYRHRFRHPVPANGERLFLVFDGIFYQADVWLDGAYLGDPEGYFQPHSFEFTDLARLAEDHVVAVEVACPPQRQKDAKRNLTGEFQHSDMIDPEWNPGGLWRKVRVQHTGCVRIDRLRLLCRDANDSRANLRLHARLDADHPRTVTIRTRVDGALTGEFTRSLASGLNEVAWDFDVADPRLWWPWSLGSQDLCDVDVDVAVDGTTTDRRTLRTGLREVALDDWTFSVNGERLFVKGANLMPTSAALGEPTPAEVRRDVELAREAGLDLLRVHGHIGRPELYDAADELGVLVWQDFPLQRRYARTVRKQAVRQARDAVDVLGHHPSIAMWCAHNDPHDADGPAREERSLTRRLLRHQLPTWNTSILDRWVKRAFEAADETRRTVAYSGVAPHLPRLDGTDSHLAFGWRDGDARDLALLAAAVPGLVRFVGEFGAQAVPPTNGFMQPERWPMLDWERLEQHHALQFRTLNERVPIASAGSFDDWAAATQRHQAEVLRTQIETLRRLKYRPTGGFCFLALNDAQPAVSWAVLDHRRHKKPAYDAVADACRPVLVVADPLPGELAPGDNVALDVHVVNDLRRPLDEMVCTALLRWPGGSHSWRWTGDAPPDSCGRVGIVRFVVPDTPGELWLDLTLEHDETVVSNRYTATVHPLRTTR